MRKLFSLIAAVLFAGSMMATEVVFTNADFAGQGTANTGSEVTATKDGVTFTYSKGYSATESLRCYAHGALTISAESTIEKINFTTTGGKTGGLDAEVTVGATSYSVEDLASQARFTEIKVTLGGGVTPPAVATPVISGDETFTESVIVTITCSTPEADIYYTTDGTTDPKCDCAAAPEYTQQIVLTETTTIMAAAYTGNDWSAVATKTFTKVDPVAEPTDCATAAAAALSVSKNNDLYNDGAVYTINGYVTSIQTAYSDQYHNITFWMADAADGGNVLEAFRAACAAEADAPAVGDKVAVTGSLTKYNTTPEFAAGCTFTIIERAGGEEPPVEEEVVITDTLTVAEAIALGMALDSMGVSEEIYAIEGYVINPGAFSLLYKNQSWYMADDATAAASDFQAYNCFPIQNNDTLKVLAGDKVQLVGKLKKYYNKNAAKYIIEVEKGDASFISMAEGDHTVVVTTEEITVAQALEIGAALADNGVSEKQYKIRGYVSAINVKASDAYSDQYKNQSFYVADDATSTAASNADGAFYVYRGKPETEAEIPVGTLVEFTCTIKKYVPAQGDPVIENADQNIVITILGDVPVEDADVIFVPADFEGQGQEATLQTPGGAVSATKDGVTVATDNGYGHNLALRVYKGAQFSITSAEQQIGKIVYQFYSNYDGGMDKEVVVNGMEYTVESLAKQARIEKIYIYFGEYEKEEVDTLTAAQALEIAQSLAVGATQKVVVKAYVAKVKTAYSEQYGNISVYLTDDPASTYGDIQAYQANCSAEDGAAIAEHDLVLVEGNVTHTQNQDGTKDYYEIAKGAQLKLLEKAQGIENVVLTEQVQKVVVDGVIYIVRDNKMFNLQGVQVR